MDHDHENPEIPRLENDEFFIHELVELERDFEDELFFECPEEELDDYYQKQGSYRTTRTHSYPGAVQSFLLVRFIFYTVRFDL